MMKSIVSKLAGYGTLRIEDADKIAATYGVPEASVEAEMMKHLSEGGEGK